MKNCLSASGTFGSVISDDQRASWAAVTDLHRMLAMLGLAAVTGHGVALVLDSTVRVTVPALFVPGLIAYRPLWTTLGVTTAETMVLIYASFSQRKRIGARNWRRLHWATYGIFVAATMHGLTAGSDSTRPWAFGLYLFAAGSVAAGSRGASSCHRHAAVRGVPQRSGGRAVPALSPPLTCRRSVSSRDEALVASICRRRACHARGGVGDSGQLRAPQAHLRCAGSSRPAEPTIALAQKTQRHRLDPGHDRPDGNDGSSARLDRDD